MNTFSKTMMQIAAFAALTAGTVLAQTNDRFEINIPFAFNVGDKTMPSGHYSISTDQTSAVWIRDVKSDARTVVEAPAADKPADTHTTKLVFRVHDGKYYLASMWNGDVASGKAFPESRGERELELAGTHNSFASLVSKK